MRLLGAVLAGGRSRRFGTDKGCAEIDGIALLQRVCNALASQCERVCVVGRAVEGYASAPDRPQPGLGPLGGVLGALIYARDNRFDEVLTSALDIPDLPPDLAERLAPAPAFVGDQPVVGRWRVADIPVLEQLLSDSSSASMRAFCSACDARPVALPRPLANINTPDDLAKYRAARSVAGPGALSSSGS